MAVKIYSLKKSKHILRHTYHLLRKKQKSLASEPRALIQEALLALQKEIMRGNREKASQLAQQVENLSAVHLRKSALDHQPDLSHPG